MENTTRRSEGSKPAASIIRHRLHRLLTTIAAHVRSKQPDVLLDHLKPGGEVPRAFLEAGLARLQAGHLDAALAILERGARAYPEDLALLQAVASLTRESGQFAEASAYWEAAARRAPDDPTAICGWSASLRANFQISRASSIIEAAVARYPRDPGLIAEAARVAALRGRHGRALHLWSDVLEHGAVAPEARAGRAEALAALLALEAKQDGLQDGPSREPAIPEVFISQGELMLEFESLGDNCEFGLVQRYSGVNPLGLFRFTETQAEYLDQVFATCFEDYGTDDDLVLDQRHGDQEYLGSSRRYDCFKYHTEVFGPDVDEAELRKIELRKLAYLKQRMLADVRSGEKIFVRKQGNYEWGMRLTRTIRAMGPNIFLWVNVADHDHPVGHVEILEPGLLQGYVSKFAWYGDARVLELDDWVAVCLNALGVAKGLKGQQVRYRLLANEILQTGRGWDIPKRCIARRVDAPRLHGQDVLKLELLEDTVRWDAIVAQQTIEAPVASGAAYVFSVWILVPGSFQGMFIDVYFAQSAEGYLRRADLDKRDVWQRIYVSTKIPKGIDLAIVSLRVTGCAGDVVYLADWRLETGYMPNPWPIDMALSEV